MKKLIVMLLCLLFVSCGKDDKNTEDNTANEEMEELVKKIEKEESSIKKRAQPVPDSEESEAF